MAESGHSLDTDNVPDSVCVYRGSWPEGISLRIPLTFPMDHFHKARNSTNGLTVSRALPGHSLSTISTIPLWSAQSQGLMALCNSGSSDLASPHLVLLLGKLGEHKPLLSVTSGILLGASEVSESIISSQP